MAKTLKLPKEIQNIINKVKEGKKLTEKQSVKLDNFLKEMELPQPKAEQPKAEQLTLDNWETLTEEQKETLKTAILKSKNGVGGENIGIFPNLLGAKETNPFILKEYGNKVENTVRQQFLNQYKDIGEVILLPLEIGTTHYLTIIKPNKPITVDTWELLTEGKPYTKYTTHNKVGTITVSEKEYIITNIQSNKNKSWNNGKRLANILGLYYNIKAMEGVKDFKPNNYFLKKDITENGQIIFKEYSTNTYKPTGKIFNSIGQYLGRELAKEMEGLDLLDYIG